MPFTPPFEAEQIFRDYIVDGVPASGKQRPVKSQIRAWGSAVEDYLTGHDVADAALDARLDVVEPDVTSLLSRMTAAESGIVSLGSSKQDVVTKLTAWLALALAADKLPYGTGADTWALADLTAAGRAILDDADAAAQRATLGVVIGTDVQAYDAELAQIAGLADPNADRILFWDDSAGSFAFLTAGTGLSISGTTISVSGSEPWQYAWHPYNKVTEGDANDGKFWDFDVDGSFTTKVTPDFVDGYEYRVRGLGLASNSSISVDFRLELFRETDAAYSAAYAVETAFFNASNLIFELTLPYVRYSMRAQWFSYWDINTTSTFMQANPTQNGIHTYTTAQKITRVRFSIASYAVAAGQLFLDRRRVNF
jgi:hypothetical protein